MYIDYSRLFHESSKDLNAGGTVHIGKDDSVWPLAWKTVVYKTYPRVKKIPLGEVKPRSANSFFDTIEKRKSGRDFERAPVDFEKLSALLKYSCGIVETTEFRNPRRAYPSGGGRAPIEIYPLIFSGSKEVPSGVYHYNIQQHALDSLGERDFTPDDIDSLFVYEWVRSAPLALIMTGVFSRTQMKYGERGYRYVFIEAGHIGQGIYLSAAALGLKCCSIVGTRDLALEKLLDLDGFTESVLYAVIVG